VHNGRDSMARCLFLASFLDNGLKVVVRKDG
jgi:hypothetical protein